MSHTKLWIPTARGEIDVRAWRVNLALKEYDERLTLAQNQHSGEWCVMMKMPPGGDMEYYPIFGCGFEPPQDAEPILQRLYKGDLVRRGQEVIKEIEDSQARYHAEQQKKLLEPNIILAETMEYAMRRFGQTPHKKVFVNGRTRRGYGEYY